MLKVRGRLRLIHCTSLTVAVVLMNMYLATGRELAGLGLSDAAVKSPYPLLFEFMRMLLGTLTVRLNVIQLIMFPLRYLFVCHKSWVSRSILQNAKCDCPWTSKSHLCF
jgi:hypothetical protein